VRATTLRLGSRDVDIGDRAVVMGVLDVNGPGAAADRSLADLVRRAGHLVDQGADLLDLEVEGGAPGHDAGGDLEAVARVVGAVTERVDVPLSVATSREAVARAAFGAGAVMVNDRTGCTDHAFLAAVAEWGATVVGGHRGPVGGAPDATADTVRDFLAGWAGQARAAGIPPDRIVLDGGLGQDGSTGQALALLRASGLLADLGHPVLLSLVDTAFVGTVRRPPHGRSDGPAELDASALAASALGAVLGCRVVRTRDVTGHRQVCAVVAAVRGAAR